MHRAVVNDKEACLARKAQDFRLATKVKETADEALKLLHVEGVRADHVK